MSEEDRKIEYEQNLRLNVFHLAREILNEKCQCCIQQGQSCSAPSTEEIMKEAEKILIFLKK